VGDGAAGIPGGVAVAAEGVGVRLGSTTRVKTGVGSSPRDLAGRVNAPSINTVPTQASPNAPPIIGTSRFRSRPNPSDFGVRLIEGARRMPGQG